RIVVFFFSSRRRHTRGPRDWSSDVCSSDLDPSGAVDVPQVALTLTAPEGSPDTSLDQSETSRASGRRGWLMRRLLLGADVAALRSEERRVGKEWRARGEQDRENGEHKKRSG